MEEEDIHLLPGMYVKAVIETGNNLVDALPEDAVVQSEGKNFIFILKTKDKEESQFEMKEVVTGVRENGFVEIELPEELKVDNLNIVREGAYSLLSKMKNSDDDGGHVH
jgi:membrane fusion protein, heavy metal efflux system